MSDFDDLLSSSSRPFEENPFANPFDKARSSSPDPWSSFGHQQEQPFQDEAYTSPFGNGFTSVDESHLSQSESEERRTILERAESDGEQGAEQVMAVPFEGHGSEAKSPGFRESVESDQGEPESTAVEEKPSNTYSPSFDSLQDRSRTSSISSPGKTPNGSATTLIPALEKSPGSSSSVLPSPPTQTNHFISPLEAANSLTQTFASLSVGSSGFGGWQDDLEPFAAQKHADDDSEGEKDVQSDVSRAKQASETGMDAEVTNAVQSSTSGSGPIPLFQISVDDPQKVGDPIRPYILYTVHTKTKSPLYSKPSFSVLRRYSDFLWLYETLSYNNPGVIVPPVPEKTAFGRFANLFVQQRRLALEICIQKIANHPVLAKDPDLKLFLESDNFALDIKHRKPDTSNGVFSSIGQSLSGPRFFEVDEWFDKKKQYLDGLESQLKGLVKAIDLVSKQRAELAIAIGDFAASIGELAESDLSRPLQLALKHLSAVQKQAQDLSHTQAQEDTMTFMATAEEYSRIINSVRLAFASRVRCHRIWQNAESEARRAKQAYEAAKAQGRAPDRGTSSMAQAADAERKANDARHDFEKCSKLVKMEVARFEEERVKDFKVSLERFLDGMILRQRELVAAWESYQDHLLKKAIPAKETDGRMD